MTVEQTRKLRELALAITRGELRRPWSVQTSRDRARHAIDYLRHKIEGHADAFAEAEAMRGAS